MNNGDDKIRLDGKSCKIAPSDFKVFVKSKSSYFYPDATITCGELEFTDETKHVIKNPTAVFEILSPSTEDFDLGRKFFFYMQVDSVKELIAISSMCAEVRIGRRQADNSWKFETLNNLNDFLCIESIGVEVSLSTIYKNIEFKKSL
jgi:Uma2 family endonuclease